jgi:hypothetical protein
MGLTTEAKEGTELGEVGSPLLVLQILRVLVVQYRVWSRIPNRAAAEVRANSGRR